MLEAILSIVGSIGSAWFCYMILNDADELDNDDDYKPRRQRARRK